MINGMQHFRTILRIMSVTVFLLPPVALATPTLNNPAPGAGLTLQDFIMMLLNIMQAVLIPVVVVAIIYSGFLMVSAGGNEQNVTKARVVIVWTLVGAAIIMGAKAIAQLAFNTGALF